MLCLYWLWGSSLDTDIVNVAIQKTMDSLDLLMLTAIGSSGTVKLAKKEPTKSAAVAKPAAAKVLARHSTINQAKTVTEGESHQT